LRDYEDIARWLRAERTRVVRALELALGIRTDELYRRLGITSLLDLKIQVKRPKPPSKPRGRPRKTLDRDRILAALREGKGCIRHAARVTGISRSTLARYVAREIRSSDYIFGTEISENHGALLAASGVSPEVAAARSYRSDRRGLIIPLWLADGQRSWEQLRRDPPPESSREHRSWKRNRYKNPREAIPVIDVSPHGRERVLDPTTRLYITESPRKADAAVSRGLACVAILGVRMLVLDADAWNAIGVTGRDVHIVFDADAAWNPEVAAAENRLADYLTGLGARVRVVRLPTLRGKEKAGLDDFLAAGHTEDELLSLAGPVVEPDISSEKPAHQNHGIRPWAR